MDNKRINYMFSVSWPFVLAATFSNSANNKLKSGRSSVFEMRMTFKGIGHLYFKISGLKQLCSQI